MRRPRTASLGLGLVMAASSLIPAAPPALGGGTNTWAWPNGACSGTLQQCVVNAASGDTILIGTDTVVDERPTITGKSLTLAAAPGFQPEIAGGLTFTASTGSQALVLRQIRLDDDVQVSLGGGSGHSVTLDRVTVRQTTGSSHTAVSFLTDVPASLSVIRSSIATTQAEATGIWFQASNSSGVASFTLVGTRISGTSGGNKIGVGVRAYGTGSVTADLHNDVFYRVANCACAGAGAVALSITDETHATIRMAGLTIDSSPGRGVVIDTKYLTTGSAAVYLYDSIISRVQGGAIRIDPPPVASSLRFHAGSNDFYRNGASKLAGRSLGSHNLAKSPGYLNGATGNLRLRSSSPLIDKGQVCSPSGVANPDADGRHRLAARSVDLGAYERGAPAVTGTVFVGDDGPDVWTGTSGRDIACGYGGGDELDGGGGPDHLDGGTGPDHLVGGSGGDRLHGQGGADVVCADDGSSSDSADGGRGTDTYAADPGDAVKSMETKLGACP